jgi:ribulose-phosphate 3-epimerase
MLTKPPPHPLVAASILSADFGRMADECRDVLDKGADLLHVDIMDGHFVPNLTMGADMVKGIRRHFPEVYIDVHLMVERPDIFVEMFAQAGANNCSFHLEVSRPMRKDGIDAGALIDRIHGLGMQAGMVVNPPTPPDGLAAYLDRLDLVLVMSVNPGRSGQAFIPEVLQKARWLKPQLRPQTRLEMDGGVNPQTVRQVVAAGVEVLVTASALFGAADRAGVIRQLHDA